MALNPLKLELLERSAQLADEARSHALKRLLELPAGEAPGPPNSVLYRV